VSEHTDAEYDMLEKAWQSSIEAMEREHAQCVRLERALETAGTMIAWGAASSRMIRPVPMDYKGEGSWGPNEGGNVATRMAASVTQRGQLWTQYLRAGAGITETPPTCEGVPTCARVPLPSRAGV
jgi:hypothetical protein